MPPSRRVRRLCTACLMVFRSLAMSSPDSFSQQALQRRIHEHGTRLKRQEVGLKVSLEAVDRLRAEKAGLDASVACLLREKKALLARAGDLGKAPCSGPDDGSGHDGVPQSVATQDVKLKVEETSKRLVELELEKDRWQTRCRELQVIVV